MTSRSVLAVLLLLAALPAQASLHVGAVEVAGDHRALDTLVTSVNCTAADGSRLRWESALTDPHHYESESWLRLGVYDEASGEFGQPREVRSADWETAALGCDVDGGVLVASDSYTDAFVLERFDRFGAAAGSREVPTLPWPFWRQVHVALPDRAFLAFLRPRTETTDVGAPLRQLGVLRYAFEGEPSGPFVVAQWNEDTQFVAHAAAADADGNVLLAWTLVHAEEPTQLWIRVVDANGNAVTQSQRIDDARYPAMPSLSVLATGDGEFLVAWKDSLPGWVGRRVSLHDPSAAPSPVPAAADIPDFLPAWTISDAPGLRGTPDLATDGHGLWMAAWRADASRGRVFAYLSMSADDGRTWSAPLGFPDATLPWQYDDRRDTPKHDVALATDSDGAWMLALMHQPARWECYVEYWRSLDHGRTWESPADAVTEYGDVTRMASWSETYDDQRCGGLDVAAAGNGNWLSVLGSVADGDGYFDSRQLFLAWSRDDGDHWRENGDPFVDARNQPAASPPVLSPSPSGAPVLAWRAHGVSGGLSEFYEYPSWGPGFWMRIWLPAVDDDDVNENQPFGLAVGSDPSGAMVMALPLRDPLDGGSGWDPDIAVARSTDLGETWSEPQTVASYAEGDGATDVAPAIAGDDDGRYLLAWNTNRGDGARLAGPSTAMAAFSADHGVSWSSPFVLDPASPSAATEDSVVAVASDRHGGWGVLLTSVLEDGREQIRFVRTRGSCGDGTLDAGEGCDDGNLLDGDGCDSNCTPPSCGNGILDDGEACDDGNPWDADACRSDCTPWRCGDGVAQVWTEECDDGNGDAGDDCTTECNLPRCGDGHVWQDHEDCEDGNAVDGDGCDTNCRWTGCGNGVATEGEDCDGGDATQGPCRPDCTLNVCGDGWFGSWPEECDDANSVDTDGCRNNCVRPRCGDGAVSQIEQCDDTNRVNTDACTNSCRLPRCGDQVLSRNIEDCEDGNTAGNDGCSPDCRWEDLCGDADESGTVSTTDARRVLRRAVDLPGACPRWTCDADGSGEVSAGDAVLVLRKSVGLPVTGNCQEKFVVHLEASAPVSEMQFTMDYRDALGMLTDDAGRLRCRWLVPGGIYAIPDPDRAARFAVITSGTLPGFLPTSSDLLECTIRRYAAPAPEDFRLSLEYALDIAQWSDVRADLSVVRTGD